MLKYPLLFKCIVGSTAYGTNTETSDTDIKGVYIQPDSDILGLNYVEQVNVGKDEVYYELRRYIDLLSSANPSVLEMLFVDKQFILYCHPAFQKLLDERINFLTKKCRDSFGGMAHSQIIKAKGTEKKMNWEKSQMVRKEPIDFCTIYSDNKSIKLLDYLIANQLDKNKCGLTNIDNMKDCYNLYHSSIHNYKGIQHDNSNHVILSSIPKGEIPLGLVLYNQDAYSQHCKKYKEYTDWLKKRNTERYVDVENHGQQIDGKNLSHAIRLLQMASEIATNHNLLVLRPNRDELLAVRKGKVDLETLITKSERMLKDVDNLYANSNLSKEVTKEYKHNLILEIRELYNKSL